MYFYENYVRLCNHIGKTPSAVAEEIGIRRSTVSRWKSGKGRTDATVQKVADYFGVPKDFLLVSIPEPIEIFDFQDVDEKEVDKATAKRIFDFRLKEKSTGIAGGLSEEEIKFIEWYRSQASDKEKALVRMIVEGND